MMNILSYKVSTKRGQGQVEEVVVATLESTPKNATHWSRAKMADRSGLSKSTIGRIWKAFELKPHREDGFKLSTDPQFVEKVYDVVGLYLNPSWRCGFSSNAFQIRPIVDFDRPERSAIFARDQCVAFFGVDSNVATTTSSTCSAVIVGGRPARGSSTRPSRRSATKRARHLLTVFVEQCTRSATALLSRPSPQPRTIRDRNANACEDFARLDQRNSCSRSSSLRISSVFGRPVLGIPPFYHLTREFQAQDTRSSVVQEIGANCHRDARSFETSAVAMATGATSTSISPDAPDTTTDFSTSCAPYVSAARLIARPARIRTHEKQGAPRPQLQTRRALALTTLDLIARTLRATKTVPLAMRKIARAVSPSVLRDAPVWAGSSGGRDGDRTATLSWRWIERPALRSRWASRR